MEWKGWIIGVVLADLNGLSSLYSIEKWSIPKQQKVSRCRQFSANQGKSGHRREDVYGAVLTGLTCRAYRIGKQREIGINDCQ